MYSKLAGYPALLGPLPLYFSLPFVTLFYPPSLGLPGFAQNICSVISHRITAFPRYFLKLDAYSYFEIFAPNPPPVGWGAGGGANKKSRFS